MSDDDLIRRGDALEAVQLGDTVTKMQARIAAIPAVDADPECTCCGGTGITFQTERRCACQSPDLVEAGKVIERLQRADEYEPVGHDAWEAADTIRALIALATTQAAQIEDLTEGQARAEQEERIRTRQLADETIRAEAAEAKVAELRHKLQAMHRRAQKAEGLSQRSANLLETILLSIKEAMKPEAKLSLHSLFHRVRAARDHARASSGRAWIEGWHYYVPKLKAAEAEAATLRDEVERLRGALAKAKVYFEYAEQWQAVQEVRATLEGKHE